VRNVNTEVELAEGQSFAIGGLLNNTETQTFEKIPFIGDIPILGKLFQSKNVSKANTELIVIVTPEIVRPIPAGHPFLPPNTGTPMQTPGQKTTGPVPVTPPTSAIPVETLLKSMQPEKPLVVRSTAGGGYMGGGQSTLQTAPAPAAAPPAAGPSPP
jgi:pilus assembly protein CpaC